MHAVLWFESRRESCVITLFHIHTSFSLFFFFFHLFSFCVHFHFFIFCIFSFFLCFHFFHFFIFSYFHFVQLFSFFFFSFLGCSTSDFFWPQVPHDCQTKLLCIKSIIRPVSGSPLFLFFEIFFHVFSICLPYFSSFFFHLFSCL